MTRLAALLILGASIAAGPACGKKGPLEMPLVREPQAVDRVNAFQRGGRVVLEWTNPAKYVDGRPLQAVGAVEVWGLESATGAPASLLKSESEDVERKARRLRRVERARFAADLGGAPNPGGVLSLTLEAPAPGRTLTLFVRAADTGGHVSKFSKPFDVKIRTCPPAPAISGLRVEKDRIDVAWTTLDPGPDASRAAAGFSIYRSEGHGPFLKLASVSGEARGFADRGFTFGRTYAYVVRAFAAGPEPSLESEDSAAAEVTPVDTYPPDAPTDVVAFAGTGSVSLSWEAVKDDDLAGYRIWRREAGAAFVAVGPEIVEQTSFTDTTPRAGISYVYAVSARDKAGNESPRAESGPVTPKGHTP